MTHWWRAYDEAVDDPKLLLLSDRQHRTWFNLLCIASAYGGKLPDMKTVAVKLRTTPQRAVVALTELVAAGLIEDSGGVFMPHNWSGRQFKSDVTDATAAERMRNYRNRKRNGAVTVTAPREQITDTETDSETERKKERDPANAGLPPKFVFESGVIRLKQKDFDQWQRAFKHLNLMAELLSLSDWAAKQKSWFPAVSAALAKRDREVLQRMELSKQPPEVNRYVDPRL